MTKTPNTILGIGTDIVEIKRIAESIQSHGSSFLNRVYTMKEQALAQKFQEPSTFYAGRFAAKEAVVKALGTGFRDNITFLDIEIINDDQGKPHVFLSERLQKQFQSPHILITISHSKENAIAFAIWQAA